jgi:hypothetical protein
MANLNSEAILASSSYVCGERKGTPHARTRSPRLAGLRPGPGRKTRARDVRVNSPSKSSSSPCGGAASFCCFIFLVAWLLGLRDMEGLVGFLI